MTALPSAQELAEIRERAAGILARTLILDDRDRVALLALVDGLAEALQQAHRGVRHIGVTPDWCPTCNVLGRVRADK